MIKIIITIILKIVNIILYKIFKQVMCQDIITGEKILTLYLLKITISKMKMKKDGTKLALVFCIQKLCQM